VGSTSRSHIFVSEKRPYSTSRWCQSRSRFYMAPASADIVLGGRMAEWLKPTDCEVLTIKLRGSTSRSHILSPKKDHIARRVGFNHVRDSIWRRHQPICFLGRRMAEWLQPADCKVIMFNWRGINYQVTHFVSKKHYIARRVGFNHVRDSIWHRHQLILF
jgi:hypothetical protein